VDDELRVRVRKGKTDRFVASPQHSMPEAIAIEGYRRIKIGDAKQKVVELSKQGQVGAHVQMILDKTLSPRIADNRDGLIR
jgi:hypothetical protein